MTSRIILLASIIAVSFTVSCKKSNSTNPVVITPVVTPPVILPVDTVAVLTSSKWQIMQLWNDYNINGIKDTMEVFAQHLFFVAYSFKSDGSIKDTTLYTTHRAGTWHFTHPNKSEFKIEWDPVGTTTPTPGDTMTFKILSITDTTMAWEKLNANQYWYLKKY